jgi:hypothetical protein
MKSIHGDCWGHGNEILSALFVIVVDSWELEMRAIYRNQ